ncbi:putative bifunctional diguanylate cyclase/phosphodiesterase [Sedimenticola selenatireducens]|uniref:cyclic-guanylate-specific phosphodiesterase n=1 Tax=Sedimenticola selenatireducens TaxID=191960 RepID=A0A557SEJ8_9GAMM|nr:EAL domain-containing protein [Sedimenticola selenatireducens]TVO75855.1 EAL domain-containing protein [Sedimenticola selenatireducens]TVT63714.1 MAG: EAL domain-containing protein [Sedimenticola selenatireducens]
MMKSTESWLGSEFISQSTGSRENVATTAATMPARILVVDDEIRMRESVRDLLEAYGHASLIAANGYAALEILREHPIELILLDLNMPEVTGLEFLDLVKEDFPDVDVVIVSGEATFANATEALRQGVSDFLRKPYSPVELLGIIENVLKKRTLEKDIKQVHQKLEASEYRYRFIVDNSPDIIYMLDEAGYFCFVNDRIGQLLDYKQNDLIGHHFSEIVHEEDVEKAKYAFAERRTGDRASRNVEFRLRCKDNTQPSRYFESRTVSIELNSMGIYQETGSNDKCFVGTYGVARDISERKRAEEIINFQLYHDLLTQLPNRALLRDRLGLAISQAKRSGTQLALMYLDMDRFKVINDSLGHVAGDQLLQTVANRLRNCLRDSDTLARVGGDEFNLLVPEVSGRVDAIRLVEKVMANLKDPIFIDGVEVFVSFSIGIAIFPDDGESMDSLIKHADIAMYHVKRHGKDGYEFFTNSMKGSADQHLSYDTGLRRALDEEQLQLYFQPQIDIQSGMISGMEALLRWKHPEAGIISPTEFIPVAEENGIINEIGMWVLDSGCAELSKWIKAGHSNIRLAVNVSSKQLAQTDFEHHVFNIMTKHGIPGSSLELEITENVLIQDMDQVVNQLRKLHANGVRIAVDDFGIGYSSLGYLQSLPLSTLKIDRSFISGIRASSSRNSIVTAIIAMSKELGLDIVAEGVETEIQHQQLKRLGCPNAQGFLFGRPMPKEHVGLFLKKGYT